jgi:hypothetical protein
VHVTLTSRETLERTAGIIGVQSAAAQALRDADSHDGPVRFYQVRSKHGTRIVVEKLAKDST